MHVLGDAISYPNINQGRRIQAESDIRLCRRLQPRVYSNLLQVFYLATPKIITYRGHDFYKWKCERCGS